MQTIFNILYALFITLSMAVGGLFLTSLVPIPGNIEMKIVQSGSMEPAVPVGAVVLANPSASYGVGDIITFGEDSAGAVPTTHRILSVRRSNGVDFYTTKGDANEEADSREVARSDVIGKVYLTIPYAGFVLDFARQPLGFVLLVGIPASLIIVSELIAIMQEIRRLWIRRKARARTKSSKAFAPRTALYMRRFPMDDIFLPVRPSAQSRIVGGTGHYAGALSSMAAVACITLAASLQNTGSTLSFFRDVEFSGGNTFTAGMWNPPAPIGDGGGGGSAQGIESLAAEAPLIVDAVAGVSEEDIANAEQVVTNEAEAREARQERGVRGAGEAREDRDAREERTSIDDTAETAPAILNIIQETDSPESDAS